MVAGMAGSGTVLLPSSSGGDVSFSKAAMLSCDAVVSSSVLVVVSCSRTSASLLLRAEVSAVGVSPCGEAALPSAAIVMLLSETRQL